ncbi:MAG: hypothetical protein PHR29_04225, partial [Acholeplasmataceae bacterium]|nr:hypothetical protein [Acholeplasmataceae bacterium]
MRESFEFKQPAPQEEQTPSTQPVAERLTAEQISQKRGKVLQSLEKARLLPSEWKSTAGKSRDEMITALEGSLEELDALETSIQNEPEPVVEVKPVAQTEKQGLHVVRRREATVATKTDEPERQFAQAGQYITIGKVHIPVCQTPEESAEWNAVPGKVFVSGGKKFSEVKFVKDAHGLTHVAKPGELMNFSEKHRGERLESVDAVLEGRGELKAFNEVLTNLGELARQYGELNPDDADYDEKAKQLGAQIEAFTDPEKLKETLKLNGSGIEDVDDFAERASDIIRTQQFLRSIDESLNEFIPPRDTHFKLTPYFEQKFAWFATLVNRQLGLGNNAYLEDLV